MAEGKETVDVEQARREIATREAVAVDVRSEEKWSEGHIPGAIHLPDADPEAGSKKPNEGVRLIVVGESSKQAKEAASKLADAGYEAVALDGDMSDWSSEDFQIQPTEDPDDDTELGAG
ncbi:MAG TPA: rhodanese-like domain-containing protein [Solirubrobacterales bacterium]|nr:rhodanese-like domain-containing protein [Solirubrobacterales bacterium]